MTSQNQNARVNFALALARKDIPNLANPLEVENYDITEVGKIRKKYPAYETNSELPPAVDFCLRLLEGEDVDLSYKELIYRRTYSAIYNSISSLVLPDEIDRISENAARSAAENWYQNRYGV